MTVPRLRPNLFGLPFGLAGLAAAGFDLRIDHRSHAEAGIALEPTAHIGVGATGIDRRGAVSDRVEAERKRRARNAAAIVADPELLLPLLSREKAVFDARDIAQVLSHGTGTELGDPTEVEGLKEALAAHAASVRQTPTMWP